MGWPRILIADHDPISRHVIGAAFEAAAQLELVGVLDCAEPVIGWPLAAADAVVLIEVPHDDVPLTVRTLRDRDLRVLLVGISWTPRMLDAALAAGATGCLVKDADTDRLVAAARAVAAGTVVFSPELFGLYTSHAGRLGGAAPTRLSAAGDAVHRLVRSLTKREHEILELLACGLSTAEVAASLRVSPATVKSHVSHALTKLRVRNRTEAVLLARQLIDVVPAPYAATARR